MATSTEAVMVKRRLQDQIKRTQRIEARCLSIVCDGDIRWVDRESAYSRLIACEHAVLDLEGSLNQVNEALRGGA